ncbi:carbohydrate-binding module family 13 protein [Hebeloma cylindrosporum]|uniref:Carbohydrate-binding module family 13 protein n=1 Tax=Hebeloma cylindrosporum TaxID=76867 RepID=A0A0C2Y227_HEBCY|nr:carbohydrate-binding module family 13 protein [Hebeloma cylindrosporum h7]
MSTPSAAYEHPRLDQTLTPGVYRIVNDGSSNIVVDLSAYDKISILAYETNDGENQKWEFSRLGSGYSIRSLYTGGYITLETGVVEGATLIATGFPMSWAVEADDFEAGVWRIRWPNSSFVFDYVGNRVTLCNRYPFCPSRLWRLVPAEVNAPSVVEGDTLEFVTAAPRNIKSEPSLKTTADTVIDVEGLKLGGNGEMSITTTTTTVTTSVTTVRRLGLQ